MSSAACLQLARDPQSNPHLNDLLEEVLQHIEEFKQAETRAQNSSWASGGLAKTAASTEMLLMLYEFEALAKLKDAKAEAVLDRALTLPNPSPKLFHTFSVLAVDAPANNKKLSMRALKVAIKLHMQAEHPDFVKSSADVRNLISMALISNEKEAMIYFKETLDMIEKRGKDEYPEVELLWLMTKAWNWGLQHFNLDKPVEAEQWCALSISMLRFLPSSKQEYHDQMMSVYGEILNRIETGVNRKRMEE
ncbi:testis-expressed sequence 11 protein isoform X4 [Elysia marginata]|uniref:Testis-expressed sequence 11 protein isoform X4 n=1 Tax=Elysia marginata TaxID=1093978 RepID=A0AAV4G400_9GAST|nr:testis-expressed sequence 11 protein isoform X4 [Elysia marginata]